MISANVRWPFVVTWTLAIVPVGYLGLGDVALKYDKVAHFVVFMIMSLLTFMCLSFVEYKLRIYWFIICIFGCCGIAAIGSEFLQHLVNPNRMFDIYDIYANLFGSIVGLSIGMLITQGQKYELLELDEVEDIELQSNR